MAVVSTVSVAPALTETVSLAFGAPPGPEPPVRVLQLTVPEAVTVAAPAGTAPKSKARIVKSENFEQELRVFMIWVYMLKLI